MFAQPIRVGFAVLCQIERDLAIAIQSRGRKGGKVRMLSQFLVGAGLSAINIAIHALVMTMVVRVARAVGTNQRSHTSLFLIAVMIPTVAVLMAAHVLEVVVWSFGYLMFDVAPAGADRLYFAFVNYTTLGYGDIVPVERWRLLGPLTAMNGVLLFGWSTAVIFEVLRRTLARTLDVREGRAPY